MAALQKDGASVPDGEARGGPRQFIPSRIHGRAEQDGSLIQIGSKQRRSRQQKLFINSHRLFPHQAVARRGDHDRVHHDGNIRPVQHPMHRTDDSRGIQHARLHGAHGKMFQIDAHLVSHQRRVHLLNAAHCPGRLGHDAGNGRKRKRPHGMGRFQVSLETGPRGAVGTGNRHHYGNTHGPVFNREESS